MLRAVTGTCQIQPVLSAPGERPKHQGQGQGQGQEIVADLERLTLVDEDDPAQWANDEGRERPWGHHHDKRPRSAPQGTEDHVKDQGGPRTMIATVIGAPRAIRARPVRENEPAASSGALRASCASAVECVRDARPNHGSRQGQDHLDENEQASRLDAITGSDERDWQRQCECIQKRRWQ
jgi:hypothetical protein